MTDIVDTKTRSRIMSMVRSSGARSTEQMMATLLTDNQITGWEAQARDLPGKPDFVFRDQRLAVFVDGCFWHGCPEHLRMPKSRTNYWSTKISGNMERGLVHADQLNALGWCVLRFWEHEIGNEAEKCISAISMHLERSNR